jgi:hypothetical protein
MLNYKCQAMSELCVEPLWYGEQPNATVELYATYLFKNKFKALNSTEYTITRKGVFLFPCLKV